MISIGIWIFLNRDGQLPQTPQPIAYDTAKVPVYQESSGSGFAGPNPNKVTDSILVSFFMNPEKDMHYRFKVDLELYLKNAQEEDF